MQCLTSVPVFHIIDAGQREGKKVQERAGWGRALRPGTTLFPSHRCSKWIHVLMSLKKQPPHNGSGVFMQAL